MVITRGNEVYPVSRANEVRKGDEADVLLFSEQADKARAWMRERGWEPLESPAVESSEALPAPEPA